MSSAVIFWDVEAPSGGANPTLVVHDQQIEPTTVDQVERQFGPAPMAFLYVQAFDGGHAPFNLDIRRDGLAFVVGEVLINGEMVVDPPNRRGSAEDVPVARWLLNYPLHLLDGIIMPATGGFRSPTRAARTQRPAPQ